MGARIIKHGKLSKEKDEYIYFECKNAKCGCLFKVKNSDKNLLYADVSKNRSIFRTKRKIEYAYKCPECGKYSYSYKFLEKKTEGW